ncbi:MAG: ABC transporter substrate-binding protein [Patescibacteria group bacterium]
MRKIYWYITIYIKKHGLVVFLSVLGAIAVFSIVLPILLSKFAFKPKKYIGLIGDYTLMTLPLEVKRTLSVGLTEVNSQKEVKPLLAERWIVEDEGKRYRFILRKDVTWQDGQAIKPEDIKYQFNDVETITTPNDVIFKLPDVFSPFPSVVSEPVFRQGIMKKWGLFKVPTLIGIGDYEIVDYKRNGNRINEITIDSPKEKLIYRFYLTENEAVAAFKKGEIDVLPNLTAPHDIINWQTVEVTPKLNNDLYLAVFFNNSSPLLPKNVRQALSYAVEKPADATRAIGPINPDSWAFLQGGKTYDKDLTRAIERLLDDVPSQPLNLDLTTTSEFAADAEAMRKQWLELGEKAAAACQGEKKVEDKALCQNLKIQINIKVTNFPDTTNFQLLLVGQETPADPDQYFLWHSERTTNFTNYKNTRIDSLLEKGRKTLEQNERQAIYQEFQQFLLEDPPAIFLRHLYSYEVRRG